jgi:DNA-directed RNA polymerase beta subunit
MLDCAHQIRTTLPFIRTDVPIVLIFKALGFTSHKTILEHIAYDLRLAILAVYTLHTV